MGWSGICWWFSLLSRCLFLGASSKSQYIHAWHRRVYPLKSHEYFIRSQYIISMDCFIPMDITNRDQLGIGNWNCSYIMLYPFFSYIISWSSLKSYSSNAHLVPVVRFPIGFPCPWQPPRASNTPIAWTPHAWPSWLRGSGIKARNMGLSWPHGLYGVYMIVYVLTKLLLVIYLHM